MNIVGETLSMWARVTGKRNAPEYGLVDLDLSIVNKAGKESTPGKATVALPNCGGKPVPYPFIAPAV